MHTFFYYLAFRVARKGVIGVAVADEKGYCISGEISHPSFVFDRLVRGQARPAFASASASLIEQAKDLGNEIPLSVFVEGDSRQDFLEICSSKNTAILWCRRKDQ